MKKILALIFVVIIGVSIYLAVGYEEKGDDVVDYVVSRLKGEDRIGDILKEPREYHGRKVIVSGVAGGAFGLAGYGIYNLSDSSGSIYVSTEKGIPPEGKEISHLKGTVQQSFTFGSKNFIVIVED